MPTWLKNKVDQNGVIKRQVINHGRPVSTRGADRKRKPCCCCSYKSGCFKVVPARAVSSCPATRMFRNLREKSKTALRCLISMRGKQLKVSSSTLMPSKQHAAPFDSHRNQAVEDCISYINSSTAPSSISSSSSSSSSTVIAILPPLKSTLPQIPQKLIATESAIIVAAVPPPPPPPPPPHFSSISIPQYKSSNGPTMEKSMRTPCP